MREEELKKEIEVLRSALTGNLLEDIEIQQKIYEIKKMLKPEIVENPELNDDEGCLSCGA